MVCVVSMLNEDGTRENMFYSSCCMFILFALDCWQRRMILTRTRHLSHAWSHRKNRLRKNCYTQRSDIL